ncbi:flagellar basal body-associated FliL family protein [Marichromatium bheemlicum]|uniref:Flagellar protein FliL n=1 Tax=Marichromatium bheemlicum TaxID=365339 RepID=A0ABX1IAN6_9GAMM|nr:flagellar basal body-associated FliL family protein [Marichromatium bheemlicum]NKN33926.1 flagellar basal body-associated FliL family protein [Marichromatium bheemlicum]
MKNAVTQLVLVLALVLGLAPLQSAVAQDEPFTENYIAIDPALIVNLASERRTRFLKVGIELYVRTAEAAEVVNTHMPLVRDRLITYFAGRSVEEVSAVEERDALRLGALKAVQEVLLERAGVFAVDGLYFGSFIIQ